MTGGSGNLYVYMRGHHALPFIVLSPLERTENIVPQKCKLELAAIEYVFAEPRHGNSDALLSPLWAVWEWKT